MKRLPPHPPHPYQPLCPSRMREPVKSATPPAVNAVGIMSASSRRSTGSACMAPMPLSLIRRPVAAGLARQLPTSASARAVATQLDDGHSIMMPASVL